MIGLALSLLSPVIGFLTTGWLGMIMKPIIAALMKLVELAGFVLSWLLKTVFKGLNHIIKSVPAMIALIVLMYSTYAYATYVKPIINPGIEKRYTKKVTRKSRRRSWVPSVSSKPEVTHYWWYEREFWTE